MYLLVTYDVETTTSEGRKQLRKVAKCCQIFGQRVQNSVFECLVDSAHYVSFKAELLSLISMDKDSIRIYHLGKGYKEKIEQFGVQSSFEIEGTLIL